MSLTRINACDLLLKWNTFDHFIDARSETEYLLDHLPTAINWPTLNDQERHDIGSTYTNVSSFEAKKRGAALAAKNIANHIEREVINKPREWHPLVYCWRGGKRSGSLALILDQIGFHTTLIEGGYKAFRAEIIKDIPHLVNKLTFKVICGTTGSGKTRLLNSLKKQGAQVLDLEDLANHRSSVLGSIPGLEQPSQKRFDTLVWSNLRNLDQNQPVYVESESKKVGNVSVPDNLILKIRDSECFNLKLSESERVNLLMEDYDFFVQDTEHFCQRLDALTSSRGKIIVESWKSSAREGKISSVVSNLLKQHYDPVYLESMKRNFTRFGTATEISPRNRNSSSMDALARKIIGV